MNIAERIGLEMEGLSMQMAALRSATEDRDTVDALALEIMRTATFEISWESVLHRAHEIAAYKAVIDKIAARNARKRT